MFQHLFGDFPALALVPRTAHGLIGIITAPLLHGSFAHLVSNSLPLLLLITLSLSVVPRAAKRAFVVIWLLSGIFVWVFGRESSHIGASGIDHGLMFFLRSEEHTSELQSLMRISYAVFCLKKKTKLNLQQQEPH